MSSIVENHDPSARFERSSNMFSIPSGAPFLKTLARALICGELEEKPTSDVKRHPDRLAECVIYLPTRRAARALGVELLEAAKGLDGQQAILLPKIRTIGDLEDEETLFGLEENMADILASMPEKSRVIDAATRQLVLARLALRWVETMSSATKQLLKEEDIVLPSSASDALHLASDLARFMDQIEAEEGNWQAITTVTPEDYGKWWQLTLNFLDIVMNAWPEFLEGKNLVNPSQFRNRIIDFRIKELDRNPPAGLIIAAGTTGSIPATARLLAKIKSMPRGRIILPGLDLKLPKNIVDRFCDTGEMGGETVASTHPQFGMVKLLQKLKTRHDLVQPLGDVPISLLERERLLNTVLLPAEDSNRWIETKKTFNDEIIQQALQHVTLIEAPGEHEEARAIALILRETLSKPDKTAALVTPDRKLASRVSVELERFNIEIDDSAGSPLLSSKPAVFLRLLLRCVFFKNDPVALSSFIKHDLIILGHETGLRHQQELLELVLVRDAIVLPSLDNLAEALDARKQMLSESKHAPAGLRELTEEDWVGLRELAAEISRSVETVTLLTRVHKKISPEELISAIKTAGESLSMTAKGIPDLYEHEGGTELLGFLETHKKDHKAGFDFPLSEAPMVFDALLSGKRTRKTGRTRPRLHIYGALEARLQNSDVLILGGLNEGVWPQTTHNDPYLNRPMRAALHLPLPERRIGLAAHDFIQFSGNEEVYYTRSLRVDDTPTIASRWLQRLLTFVGKEHSNQLTERGARYLDLGKQLDTPTQLPPVIKPPDPCPPVSKRPNRLSITEIETWIRDPYAIYAKHVLKLYPLPPLVRVADPALRGSIYHEILARFTGEWKGQIDEQARGKFTQIADAVFAEQNLPPEVLAEWRPRVDPVGDAFLYWEETRREAIKNSHCEIRLNATIGDTGFILHGYADRIDEHKDGSLTLIDYKTGSNPSMAQARTISPQLSLEAALAMKGEVEGIAAAPINQMLYVRLKPGEAFKADEVADKKRTSEEIAEDAYGDLIEQIKAYREREQGYLSQYAPIPNKSYAGDYDHLARMREWSIGADDDSGGEE